MSSLLRYRNALNVEILTRHSSSALSIVCVLHPQRHYFDLHSFT